MMMGVILAGGRGTRLLPLTERTNKHLLKVGGATMLEHNLRALAAAGVRDAIVVTDASCVESFGPHIADAARYGLGSIELASQDGANGIADALRCARSFTGERSLLVLLGDNLFGSSLAPHAKAFRGDAMVLLAETETPAEYGIAELDGGQVARVVEKPSEAASNLAVVGAYFYRSGVYEIIDRLSPSERGELEISDLNNAYAARGELEHRMLDGWWADAGTHDGLARAERLIAEHGINGAAPARERA